MPCLWETKSVLKGYSVEDLGKMRDFFQFRKIIKLKGTTQCIPQRRTRYWPGPVTQRGNISFFVARILDMRTRLAPAHGCAVKNNIKWHQASNARPSDRQVRAGPRLATDKERLRRCPVRVLRLVFHRLCVGARHHVLLVCAPLFG